MDAPVTSIEFEFGGEPRRFHLDIPRLRALQDACGAGPPEILQRLASGRARIEDVQEPIRLGLVGGGMTPIEASKLVRTWVDERPFIEGIAHASLILGAALLGNEPAKEPPEGKRKAARSRREGASTSPRSKPTR